MSNWQETSQASLFNANLNKEKLKFLEMFPESVEGRNHPKMKGHHIPIHVHEMHTSSLDTQGTRTIGIQHKFTIITCKYCIEQEDTLLCRRWKHQSTTSYLHFCNPKQTSSSEHIILKYEMCFNHQQYANSHSTTSESILRPVQNIRLEAAQRRQHGQKKQHLNPKVKLRLQNNCKEVVTEMEYNLKRPVLQVYTGLRLNFE